MKISVSLSASGLLPAAFSFRANSHPTTSGCQARSKPGSFRSLWLTFLFATGASPAFAADYTWTGGGGNNTWSTAANWGGAAPASGSATAVFFGTAPANRVSPNLSTSTTVGSITFNSGASAFTISRSSTSTLTLADGGSVTNNSSNLQTITAAVVLGGTSFWNAAAGNLSVGGVISGAGGSLTKTGDGTLTLSGANTYTGGTTISSGILQVGNGGRLGSGGVTNHGVLTYNSTGNITENNLISGTGSLIQSGSGATNLTAANTYQGGTTISGGVLQFSSSGNFGSGAVTLNGGSLRWATGNTADVSGVLTLGGGVLDTNGNNVTFASTVVGSGPLIKTGAGVLTVSAAPAGVTSVTVTGGTLRSGAAGALPAGLAYTVGGSGSSGSATLDLNGSNLTVGSLTLGGITSGANAINTVATGAGVLSLGGNVSYLATNNPGMASITGQLDLGSGTRTFNIADSTNAVADLMISASIRGAGGAINKTGAGLLALSGINTHTGGSTISEGTLEFSSSANFGTGPVRVNGFYSTLRWAAGNTEGVAGGIIITGGYGRLDTHGNDVTLASAIGGSGSLMKEGAGTLTMGAAPGLTAMSVHGGTLRLNADHALPSVTNLTVAGTAEGGGATLDLDGHDLSIGSLDLGSYYSGRNAINRVTTGEGTLTLGGNVTYAVQGGEYEYYDPGTAVIAGKLNLGTGTRTFNIAHSYNTTFEMNVSADISGAGGLTKTGNGTLVLGGVNTYAGDTTISGGVLRATLPATSNLRMNGGVLELAGDRSFVYGTGAGQIQWTGGGGGFSAFGGNRSVEIKDGNGTSLDLVWGGGNFVANDSNLTLSSSVSDSTLTLANDIDLNGGTRRATVNNGSAATDALLSGVLSNGGLLVDGAGTLKLTGLNTFAGGISVSGRQVDSIYSLQTTGATVEFASGSLGSGPVTLDNGSRLRWAAGNTDSLGGMTITVGAGGATLDTNGNDVVLNAALGGVSNTRQFGKTGEGVLTLNAVSFVNSGYATVSGGTLRLGVAGAFGTSQYSSIAVNAQTPGGSATFDTNGQDFSAYSLAFGGRNAQANATNTISTGSGTLYFTNGGINYSTADSATSDPGAAFLTGNLNLFENPAVFTIEDSSNTTEELTVSANISGSQSVTKTGAGTLVLSGNNTYTGTTTLSSGTLVVGSASAFSTGTLVLGGGTLRGDGIARTFSNPVSISGNPTFGGASDLTILGSVALGSTARTFNVTNTAATTLGGVLSGSAALTKSGEGTLALSGTSSTYTGRTNIAAGTLSVAKLDVIGSGRTSSLGAPTTAANGTIHIGATTTGATLKYTGATATTNRIINLAGTTGGATLDASGTGAITFSSNFTATGTGSKTLSLTGNHTGMNTLSGAIVNNSATNRTSLEKNGSGTWVLSGANTYTGSTTINGGRLLVDGSLSLNSSVAINNGAFLGGRGTVGAVTINSGGTIAPGNSPGTLTTGSETWNGGGTYAWEIRSATGTAGTDWDVLDIEGTLTIAGTVPAVFVIDVISLTTADTEGQATGFSPDANYSWMIASARDGISGFDPDKFVIETGNFANDPNSSAFTLSQVGNDLVLNYTAPIPEPSILGLIVTAALGGTLRRRRKN